MSYLQPRDARTLRSPVPATVSDEEPEPQGAVEDVQGVFDLEVRSKLAPDTPLTRVAAPEIGNDLPVDTHPVESVPIRVAQELGAEDSNGCVTHVQIVPSRPTDSTPKASPMTR